MADSLRLPVVEQLETPLSPLEIFEGIKDENGSFFWTALWTRRNWAAIL
jgi:hypothetical protein